MKNTKPGDVHKRREGRILIVDDDKDFALSLVDILEPRGYQVVIAHSAPNAQEKARAFDAQVALLDIRLGHDSGIDLIAPLKETRPAMLCVMMTAYATVNTAIEAIQRGAYDYLQKPLDVRHLLATLGRCFEKLRLEHEKAVAEEALRARNRELAMLNLVGQELSATLDQFQITERLLQTVTEIVSAEGASVWLWEEEQSPHFPRDALQPLRDTLQRGTPQDWLVCWAASAHDQGSSPVNLRVRPDQGVVGWVVRNGKSIIVLHASDNPHFFPGIDEQTGLSTLSLLAVPLWVRGKVIGALEVVNKLDGDFDEKDLILVETLAASAAIAIDNAQLVEALRQYTIELEAHNEDLGAFAHTAAHDIKGPLAHMIGFAEELERSHAVLPDMELRRYLHTIARSGRKMSNIVDELLLWASVRRLEEVQIKPLNMARIVAEAQGRLTDLIEAHQAKIVTPPQEAWPAALGYGPWVEEVWVNYLSNALKYGGRPPLVELDGAVLETNGMVRFWVRDNGPGLTPEERGRLFKSFERLDQVRAKGHGLGLSIARRIVEKLGGQVGVESEVGVGSTFWFTLPAQTTGT